MKNALFGLLLTFTFANAENNATLVKPSYDQLSTEGYTYNPLYNDEEIEEAKKRAEKKKKQEAQEKERKAKKEVEYKALQKKNKAQYEKAMAEANSRKSTITTKNSIIISDKPIKP